MTLLTIDLTPEMSPFALAAGLALLMGLAALVIAAARAERFNASHTVPRPKPAPEKLAA